MALTKVPFKPGIHKDDAALTVEGTWTDGNNVRFYRGSPEKIGGWQKLLDDQLLGKVRGMVAWVRNNGDPHLGLGTHLKLYAIVSEALRDITPLRSTVVLTDPFTTTSGSPNVSVAAAGHGLDVGATVVFTGASDVGGITLNGVYVVTATPSSSVFEVTHTSAASSTVAGGGGSVSARYEINPGNEYGALAYGFGVGPFGAGTYGTPREESVIMAARTWSLANWGENLLAVPRNGSLYEWSTGSSDRAAKVAIVEGYTGDAPSPITAMFVTPERFVVLLGTQEYGTGNVDPLLVRWSNQEAVDEWEQVSTNLAGEYKLSTGSKIIAGTVSRLQNLIWTDTALYSMQYRADIEFVFGFDVIGTNCGLAGPNAFAEKDGMAFWMTPNGQFYLYDGAAPRALDCPNQRFVYDTIVRQQFDAIHCGINSKYSEVFWWYSDGSGNTNENNRYISYNYADNAWFIGDMARTAWFDKTFFDGPIGIGPDGYVYVHEVGSTADGLPMNDRIETAPFDMDDGDMVVNLSRIVPDMELTGAVDFTIRTRRFPNKPMEMELVRPYSEDMHRIDLRAQGRQMSLSISSRTAETSWRMGDLRVDVTPAGPR